MPTSFIVVNLDVDPVPHPKTRSREASRAGACVRGCKVFQKNATNAVVSAGLKFFSVSRHVFRPPWITWADQLVLRQSQGERCRGPGPLCPPLSPSEMTVTALLQSERPARLVAQVRVLPCRNCCGTGFSAPRIHVRAPWCVSSEVG